MLGSSLTIYHWRDWGCSVRMSIPREYSLAPNGHLLTVCLAEVKLSRPRFLQFRNGKRNTYPVKLLRKFQLILLIKGQRILDFSGPSLSLARLLSTQGGGMIFWPSEGKTSGTKQMWACWRQGMSPWRRNGDKGSCFGHSSSSLGPSPCYCHSLLVFILTAFVLLGLHLKLWVKTSRGVIIEGGTT